MPRPVKTIRFKCPKCHLLYMGEQEATRPWPTDKLNWHFCEVHRRELFYNDHCRHILPDYDMEPLGSSKNLSGMRY